MMMVDIYRTCAPLLAVSGKVLVVLVLVKMHSVTGQYGIVPGGQCLGQGTGLIRDDRSDGDYSVGVESGDGRQPRRLSHHGMSHVYL